MTISTIYEFRARSVDAILDSILAVMDSDLENLKAAILMDGGVHDEVYIVDLIDGMHNLKEIETPEQIIIKGLIEQAFNLGMRARSLIIAGNLSQGASPQDEGQRP